ncbi:MAG TPA: hypothetical protein VF234_03130, partial [Limnochordia bacterium]
LAAEGRWGDADAIARALAAARARLLAARSERVPPSRDEKVITAWNGMMIGAFAQAGAALGEPAWVAAAARAARFVERHLVAEDGRLRRYFKDGPASVRGFLDDYVYFAQGLIELYRATFDRGYLERAIHWMQRACELFWDEAGSGFFTTDHDEILHRPKDLFDESVPSANAVAASNLLRLADVADGSPFRERAEALLSAAAGLMRHGWGTAALIAAYDLCARGLWDVVIVRGAADQGEALFRPLQEGYWPYANLYVIDAEPPQPPLLWQEKRARDGKATGYVCRAFSCSAPVTEWDALRPLIAVSPQA